MSVVLEHECRGCGTPISLSELLYKKRMVIGDAAAVYCAGCAMLDMREGHTVAVRKVALAEGLSSSARKLAHGLKETRANIGRDWRSIEIESKLERSKFGVKDEEIGELHREIDRKDTPVVIVVAPTGSGKSTFIPYSLLRPGDGYRLDHFTRHGQIVVTQPRRQATVGIAGYVGGTLLGGKIGAGHEVGYRIGGQIKCDWSNSMAYVTDGTLINYITQGYLDRIGMVIIDEAHERSLNIDVILAMMTKALPSYPRLKMLIVSATIDHQRFVDHFTKSLPGHLRCGLVNCSGQKPADQWLAYRRGNLTSVPYKSDVNKELSSKIDEHIAAATVRLAMQMECSSASDARVEKGDILAFLHGRNEIDAAVKRIKSLLAQKAADLASRTDVLPLYAGLGAADVAAAIDEKDDPERLRIVVSNNIAETSLTIAQLKHVVESGLIKQTRWNPVLEASPLLPILHSKAGCRQRWGRVGRSEDGNVWCLYTAKQFEDVALFSDDTAPEILRSNLEDLVLKLSLFGVDDITSDTFPWLDKPLYSELDRSIASLRKLNALDERGRITTQGVELARAGLGQTGRSRIMAACDRFGLGIEAATIIPFLEQGNAIFNMSGPGGTRPPGPGALQIELRDTCCDDLDLCLTAQDRITAVTQSQAFPKARSWRWPPLPRKATRVLGEEGTSLLKQGLGQVCDYDQLVKILEPLKRIAALDSWSSQCRSSFNETLRHYWLTSMKIDPRQYESKLNAARLDIIRDLGRRKKELEDRDLDLESLDRIRLILAREMPERIFKRVDHLHDEFPDTAAYVDWHQPDLDAPPLLIDRRSQATFCPPDIMLAPGDLKPGSRRSGRAGEDHECRYATFVVSLDSVRFQEVVGLTDIELADYFARHYPRKKHAERDIAARRQARTMAIKFPRGTTLRCRLNEPDGAKVTATSVMITDLPYVDEPADAGSCGTYASFDDNTDCLPSLDDWGLSSGDRGQAAPEYLMIPEIMPIEEPDDEEGEVTDPFGEDALAPAARDLMPDEGHPVEISVRRLEELPPSGTDIEVEITGVGLAPDGNAALHAHYPGSKRQLEQFAARFVVGQTIALTITSVSEALGADGLSVIEEQTGLSGFIPAAELLPEGCTNALKFFDVGEKINVQIQSVDGGQHQVAYTLLPQVERAITALLDCESLNDGAATFKNSDEKGDELGLVKRSESVCVECEARVIDVSMPRDRPECYVRVLIEGSDTQGMRVPLCATLSVDRSAQSPTGMFEVGKAVRVALRRPRMVRLRGPRSGLQPSDDELALLEGAGIVLRDNTLCSDEPFDHSTCQRLVQAARPELAGLIRKLHLRGLMLKGKLKLQKLEDRFSIGQTVEARVYRVARRGVDARIGEGYMGFVAHEEIHHWDTRNFKPSDFVEPDQVIRASVIGFNKHRDALALSLKALRDDPWNGYVQRTYEQNSIHEGVVQHVELRDSSLTAAYVRLEPGLDGKVHLDDEERQRFSGALAEGAPVKVIVTRVNSERQWVALKLVEVLSPDHDVRRVAVSSGLPAGDEIVDWFGEWPWTQPQKIIKPPSETIACGLEYGLGAENSEALPKRRKPSLLSRAVNWLAVRMGASPPATKYELRLDRSLWSPRL